MSSPKNSSQKLLFRDPRKYWGHLATSAWEKICNNFLCFGTPIFPSGASTQWKMMNNYIELIAKGHFGVASTTLSILQRTKHQQQWRNRTMERQHEILEMLL
jgi:hypothetical protein